MKITLQEAFQPFIPSASCIILHPNLGPSHALVHGFAWRFQKTGHGCYASIDTISSETGLSKATICRCLNDLEKNGFIIRERRKNNSGACITNILIPTFPITTHDDSTPEK